MAPSTPAASGRIYISYRLRETAPYARLLREELSRRLGDERVLMDVHSVEVGIDFAEAIERAVDACQIFLALIGPQWLATTDANGQRRLDNPDDLVRLELEAALARRILVIPILIEGARMPGVEELPDSLATLAHRHAFRLSLARVDADTTRLIRAMNQTIPELQMRPPLSWSPSEPEPLRPGSGSWSTTRQRPSPSLPIPSSPGSSAAHGHQRRRWLPLWLARRRTRATQSEPPEAPMGQGRRREPEHQVSFTAGYPGLVTPHTWYSLSVYVHLASLQGEVAQHIAREARHFGLQPAVSNTAASTPLPRGTRLQVSPEVQGLEFNPPVQEVRWLEDLQHVVFRMRATSDAAGRAMLGAVEVRAGPLLVGQVPLSIRVRGADAPPEGLEAPAVSTTWLFSSIFASYAHEDDHVVRAFAEAYRALGIDVLIDKTSLRAGDRWQKALTRLIEEADLFQLFWSDAASRSLYVAEEWHRALELQDRKGERFIRPVYWSTPWPPPPAQLVHLHFASLDLAVLANIAGQ